MLKKNRVYIYQILIMSLLKLKLPASAKAIETVNHGYYKCIIRGHSFEWVPMYERGSSSDVNFQDSVSTVMARRYILWFMKAPYLTMQDWRLVQ